MATTNDILENIGAAQEELSTTAEDQGWPRRQLEEALDYVHNVAHRVDPHCDVSQFGDNFETIKQIIKKHLDIDVDE
jgi:hypothetical protein